MPSAEVVRQMFTDGSKPATYGWVIDVEHVREPDDRDEAGTKGPSNIAADIEARLDAGEGRQFQLHDADELAYTGRIIVAPGDEGSETDFAPLDDFGKPNAGCVEIRYFDEAKQVWEEL
ncbi:hypothetical protein AB0H73_06370 [Streptomyces olivoreticuli]